MKKSAAALSLLFCVMFSVPGKGQPDRGEAPPIVQPGSVLERLFGGGTFTEGPAVAADGGVFFSDLTFTEEGMRREAGHLWRYDPVSGRCSIFRSPSNMSNGIKFDASGRMVVAEGDSPGGGRLIRTEMSTGRSEILAAFFKQKPFNSPNDLSIDRRGRIFFTDPRYGGVSHLPQPVRGVYRLDPDGRVTLLIGDISVPNGIVVSPDQRRLYVGCFDDREGTVKWAKRTRPERMAILEYTLNCDGSVRFERVFADYGDAGGPDGLTVDQEGNLYAALRREDHPGVAVYDPAGRQIGFIPVPEIPSNLAFDRPPGDNRLYITAGKSLYRISLTKRGIQTFQAD